MKFPGTEERGNKPEGSLAWGQGSDPAELRKEALRKIRRMQALVNRGLWVVAIFLALAILGFNDFDLVPSLPAGIRENLGAAPPVRLIQVALVVYGFSAAVLILARMARGSQPSNSWLQLGYLMAFFFFFNFAQALDENFWAVFAAGSMILGLEAFHGWSYWTTRIRHEQELLSRFDSRN
jgi:hypothetical protein